MTFRGDGDDGKDRRRREAAKSIGRNDYPREITVRVVS